MPQKDELINLFIKNHELLISAIIPIMLSGTLTTLGLSPIIANPIAIIITIGLILYYLKNKK